MLSAAEAWELTRAISPRRTVRVYAADGAGNVLNSCPSAQFMAAGMPSTTWAMNTAGTDGLYWYLPFDLDAKTPDAARRVPADLAQLTALLDELGIAYLVCASGPTGGRHVWIGLKDHQPAETIAQLARLAKDLLPTLDITPLSNAATGCVRPPGAPHRAGGSSVPLSGDLDVLRSPSTSTADIEALMDRLAALALSRPAPESPEDAGSPPRDAHGRLYIPGTRRPLSPSVAAALDDPNVGDASATLWKILCGAAASRWRHADVAALVLEGRPGLERVRTLPGVAGRLKRPERGTRSPAAVLRIEWDKAVRRIALRDVRGDDPTFDVRAAAIAAHVRELQERADAAAGRWGRGHGPTERRVLDVLSMLAVQALTPRVGANIRRLALTAGIGRETARTALLALAEDGWIGQTADAEGPNAAEWSIDPKNVLHREPGEGRSLADTPRGSAEREVLLRALSTRISAFRHEVFSYGTPLGLRLGNLYSRLSDEVLTTAEVTARSGMSAGWVSHSLQVLAEHGLAENHSEGWTVATPDRRDELAAEFGVAGRLEARRELYELEQELWAWWLAESEWMKTPWKDRRRRPGPTQLALLPDVGTNRHGAFPRRPGGGRDLRVARKIIEGTPVADAYAVVTAASTKVEDLVSTILGGRLIGTERITPPRGRIATSDALVLTA